MKCKFGDYNGLLIGKPVYKWYIVLPSPEKVFTPLSKGKVIHQYPLSPSFKWTIIVCPFHCYHEALLDRVKCAVEVLEWIPTTLLINRIPFTPLKHSPIIVDLRPYPITTKYVLKQCQVFSQWPWFSSLLTDFEVG